MTLAAEWDNVGLLLGDRSATTARDFITDIAGRLKNRIQLTSDGHRVYVEAVERAFGADVDYAMLIKQYTNDREGEVRYSPAECTGTRMIRITGTPDEQHISTSFVERQSLSVRMTNRRYTRLTNGFSKKIENHAASVALGYFAYNFIKIHATTVTQTVRAPAIGERSPIGGQSQCPGRAAETYEQADELSEEQ
jgi:hypothetical protein